MGSAQLLTAILAPKTHSSYLLLSITPDSNDNATNKALYLSLAGFLATYRLHT